MSDSPRRDGAIVAWHEVPGKRAPKDPSRRVRYDRAQLIPEVFLVEMCAVFLKEGDQSEILVDIKAWMLPGPRQKESTIRRGSEKRKAI